MHREAQLFVGKEIKMTDGPLTPQCTENGVPYYELTQRFELYTFTVGADVLGQQKFWVSNLAGYVSIAFVCPFCGKLWARRRWLDIASWAVLLRPCNGSLLDQDDFAFIDTMPTELMEHELSIFKGDQP